MKQSTTWVRIAAAGLFLVLIVGGSLYARTGHDIRHTVIGQLITYGIALLAVIIAAGFFVAAPSAHVTDVSSVGPRTALSSSKRERGMLLLGFILVGAGTVGPIGLLMLAQSLTVVVAGWLNSFVIWLGAAVVMVGIFMVVQAILSAARR